MKTTDLEAIDRDNIAYDANDIANIFNINERDDIGKYFNLNKTLIFLNVDELLPSLYQEYALQEEDHWTLLANKFYGDVNLWWFLCKINSIMDPTSIPEPGTIIKIPTTELKNLMIEGLAQG